MKVMLLTLSAMLFYVCDVYAIQAIGRFLAEDAGCEVIHQGTSKSCNRQTELYPDDVVVIAGNVKNIKVQWLIPQRTRLEPAGQGRYRIAYDSNSGKSSSFIGSIGNYFKKSAHEGQYMVSRGGAVKISPQPGSTLLTSRAVVFSWCEKGPVTFTIRDMEGKEKFRRQVNDVANLPLVPAEIGLSPGGAYSWAVEGKTRYESQFTVLNSAGDEEVEAAFRSSVKGGDDLEHVTQNASFAIFLSDDRPDSFNLKWLASQLVDEHSEELYTRDKKLFRYLELKTDTPRCEF